MISKKSLLNLVTISITLPAGFGIIPSSAQITPTTLNNKEIPNFQIAQIFQPPNLGAPRSTAGGGTRGPADGKQLTALIPKNKVGLTVSEYPTFFVYVPHNSPQKLKFVIQDENEDIVYEKSFTTTGKPGIVSIALPATPEYRLQVEKMYNYSFEVVVDPNDSSANPTVEAWVKRVEPNQTFVSNLVKSTEPDRAGIYAKNGIWHETIASAIKLRCANPNDKEVMANWVKLMDSVDLKAISTAPALDCCKFNN